MAQQLPAMSPSALAGYRWLEKNRVQVRTEYLHQWVAAGTSGLVAHNQFIDKVIEQVKQQGLQPADVAVYFIAVGIME